MTRRDLLNRLNELAGEGQDMDLPLRVEMYEHVTDRRTRRGFRTVTHTGDLKCARSGRAEYLDGVTAATLRAAKVRAAS